VTLTSLRCSSGCRRTSDGPNVDVPDDRRSGGWWLDADGMLPIPEQPGLGLELKREAVLRYTRGGPFSPKIHHPDARGPASPCSVASSSTGRFQVTTVGLLRPRTSLFFVQRHTRPACCMLNDSVPSKAVVHDNPLGGRGVLVLARHRPFGHA